MFRQALIQMPFVRVLVENPRIVKRINEIISYKRGRWAGKTIFAASLFFLFSSNVKADYTVPAGSIIDASTITSQSGVLTIYGTLKISSNVNLANFTRVVINSPGGQIFWSNNSDLTFTAGTGITIESGAPGLQSKGNNASQRLIIGSVIIAVSNDNSNAAAFDFTQVNELGGLPEYTTSNSNNVCEGNAITASVTPEKTVSGVTYSYAWSISPSSGIFSYNNDHSVASISPAAGSYTLSCVASANTYSQTFNFTITVKQVVTPVPTSNSPVCSGSSLTLNTPCVSGAIYSWTGPNGFTSSSCTPVIPNATSANAGTYNVSVTSAQGCSSGVASKTVTVSTPPSATISYSGTPFCTSVSTAKPVTRTGTAGGIYTASAPGLSIDASTGAITPSTSAAGTYTVTYTIAASGGCSLKTATTSVTISSLPSATISYGATSFCTSVSTPQVVNRTGTSGGTYSASPSGLSINALTGAITPSASTAGTYTVNYTMAAGAGCSVQTATTSVTIASVPDTPVPTSNSPVCLHNPISLTAPALPGATYVWNGPTGFNSSDQSPTISTASLGMSGTYSVVVTSPQGCSSSPGFVSVSVNLAFTWFGTDLNWSDASNWCPTIPISTYDVLIPTTANNPVIKDGTIATVNNITIESGAILTVNGTLQVKGSITNNGILDLSNGTLEMNGSSAQSIAGSTFYNKTIKNLIVSNAAGLSVSSSANDTLKISGGLTFGTSNATLNTGDNIDFLSTASGTAYLGPLGSSNSITGKAIVDRYVNLGSGSGQHTKAWEFLTAPTDGQSIRQSWMENGSTAGGYGIWLTAPGGISSGWDATSPGVAIKTYNPAANSWNAVTSANNAISNRNGYMVFIRGDRTVNGTTVTTPKPTILRSKGTLNTGAQAPILLSADQYQSIGNPYPAPIDFAKLSRLDGVDDKFYVWDPYLYGVYGYGGYQTITATNGWVPVPGGTKSYPAGEANSNIRSGQAFFVHATSSSSFVAQKPTISIDESSKTTSSSNFNFARIAKKTASPQREFLRTNLIMSPDQNAPVADGNAVAFDPAFSNKVDGDDALKFANSGENFGIKSSGKLLAVEARSQVSANDTITFNMSSMRRQTYLLQIVPVNMQSETLQCYLLDSYLNTSTALSLSDTNRITFSVTAAAASSAPNRFSIVFREMSVLPVTLTSFQATPHNNDVLVAWKTQNESGMMQYEVQKSSDGVLFTTSSLEPALNNGTGNYRWADTQLMTATSFYRIKMVSKDGKITYSDVVKVNAAPTLSLLTVAPNPVVNGTIHLVFKNEPAGKYEITLSNQIGQEVMSKTILHNSMSAFENISCSPLPKGMYNFSINKPDGSKEIMKIIFK